MPATRQQNLQNTLVSSSTAAEQFFTVTHERAMDRDTITVKVPDNFSHITSIGTERVADAHNNLDDPDTSLLARSKTSQALHFHRSKRAAK